MARIDPPLPDLGGARGIEEADVTNSLLAILGVINGGIDADNIADGSLTEAELGAAVAGKLNARPVFYPLTGGAALTNALGGAWQQVPGMAQVVTLNVGQQAVLDAVVSGHFAGAAAGTIQIFWTVSVPGAASGATPSPLPGAAKATASGIEIPITATGFYTATAAGAHTFQAMATALLVGSGAVLTAGDSSAGRVMVMPG